MKNKFLSFIGLIFFGRTDKYAATSNNIYVQSSKFDEVVEQAQKIDSLEVLGQRIQAAKAAYERIRKNKKSTWAKFYWQVYKQLEHKWPAAVEFYSNPDHKQIVFELGSAKLLP